MKRSQDGVGGSSGLSVSADSQNVPCQLRNSIHQVRVPSPKRIFFWGVRVEDGGKERVAARCLQTANHVHRSRTAGGLEGHLHPWELFLCFSRGLGARATPGGLSDTGRECEVSGVMVSTRARAGQVGLVLRAPLAAPPALPLRWPPRAPRPPTPTRRSGRRSCEELGQENPKQPRARLLPTLTARSTLQRVWGGGGEGFEF